MGGVGVAGLERMQAAGEKEGVFQEAVVEVVVYQLAQLGIYASRRRRHGGRVGDGGCRASPGGGNRGDLGRMRAATAVQASRRRRPRVRRVGMAGRGECVVVVVAR